MTRNRSNEEDEDGNLKNYVEKEGDGNQVANTGFDFQDLAGKNFGHKIEEDVVKTRMRMMTMTNMA